MPVDLDVKFSQHQPLKISYAIRDRTQVTKLTKEKWKEKHLTLDFLRTDNGLGMLCQIVMGFLA